jgi:hypothetical protein
VGESRAQEHDARARVRMGWPARERASKGCSEREAERVGPRARARGRERESSVFVYFMHRALSGYGNGCVSRYVFYRRQTEGCILHMV